MKLYYVENVLKLLKIGKKMYKKIFIFFVIFFIFNFSTLNGAELISNKGKIENNNVCGFVTYTLKFDNPNSAKEITITDQKTSRIVYAASFTSEKYPLIFPNNINKLNIYISEKAADSDQSTNQLIQLNVKNCGNKEIVDEYVVERTDQFIVENNTIKITPENPTDLTMVKAGVVGEKLKAMKGDEQNNFIINDVNGNNIYHVEFIYKDDAKVFYEIQVNTDNNFISSRLVNSFEQKKFDIKLNLKWMWITLGLFSIFIILTILYKKARRKEKKILRAQKLRRSK